mmetsp:Transcript_22677/g.52935  ORF Transcript_22677/g.52935 Transcript_22677/m.52935 type:complete len:183 (-) Transcript_22677:52-600(-)
MAKQEPSAPLTPSQLRSSVSAHALSGGRHMSESDHTFPCVGTPEGTRLMAPHPFSPTRKGSGELPDIGMKDIWRMRAKGNFVIQNSRSSTYAPEASGSSASEFKSHDTLTRIKAKHTRSTMSPCEKYVPRAVSSHAVGWHAETDWGRSLQRSPDYGIQSSSVTRYHDNMLATNMQLCLRLCK